MRKSRRRPQTIRRRGLATRRHGQLDRSCGARSRSMTRLRSRRLTALGTAAVIAGLTPSASIASGGRAARIAASRSALTHSSGERDRQRRRSSARDHNRTASSCAGSASVEHHLASIVATLRVIRARLGKTRLRYHVLARPSRRRCERSRVHCEYRERNCAGLDLAVTSNCHTHRACPSPHTAQ